MSEDQEETTDQSRQIAERDKFFMKYGIELGLLASATPELSDISQERIDQIYRNRIKHGISM